MQTRMHTATAIIAALTSVVAVGADWEFNPRVEAGYLYDDNYRLTSPGTETSVQGPLADAQLEFRSRTPTNDFSFTPRVRATYFSDEQELDYVDYFGLLDWRYEGQTIESRVRGEYAKQDIVNSEQPDAELPGDVGLGDPDIGDSGRVLVPNRRTRAAIRPLLNVELSQKRALEFGANFADVSFDREFPGAQVDYQSGDVSAGLLTRFSEVSSLLARVRAARYDIEALGDSESYGAELEWTRRTVTEMETFLRAGAQNVKFEDGIKETAWLFGAGVNMPIGRNQLFADLTHSVGPSSAGIVITRDQLRVRWTRDITPRLAFLLGVRGTHDEDIREDGTYRPRRYATGDVGLQWHWQEEFSLIMAYDYSWQEFDDALVDAATSSGARVTVLYQPLQRRR
jgi:hypothetical protein